MNSNRFVFDSNLLVSALLFKNSKPRRALNKAFDILSRKKFNKYLSSVPTIPALARARRYLDEQGASGRVTLIITGGLRVPIDFVKALALGADGVAISNSAIQAVGCVAARMCNTNNCPTGIATQKPELRRRLNIEKSSVQLHNFFNASVELMQVMARACGHDHLNKFNKDDLATWHREMALLSGVKYSGFVDLSVNG